MQTLNKSFQRGWIDRRAVGVRPQTRRPMRCQAMAAVRRATDDDKLDLINKAKCFIFDCDGVIWRGDSVIEGVPETLEMMRSLGKRLFFVTNNSTKSRAGYLKKFQSLGLDISADEIYSSSYAAAAYLDYIKFDKKAYVVGEVGILEELDKKGIKHLGGPEDANKKVELQAGGYMEHDPQVGAVIVGFDRHINYHKIQYATLCIRENPGCLFIATNRDAVTHLTDAQEWAGNGSMVGAIAGSTKREPFVVGKPSEFMLDDISKSCGFKRSEICMVGDRLDTDILFGKNGGLATCLCLSGVTTEEQLLSPDNTIMPDVYMDQLSEVLTIKGQLSGGKSSSARPLQPPPPTTPAVNDDEDDAPRPLPFPTPGLQYPRISPREAKSLYMDRNFAFWDIRTPEEHLTGAKRWMTNVPFAVMTPRGPKLSKDFKPMFEKTFPSKLSKVILACDDCERSEMAYELLEPLGYTNIKLVEGGLNEYLKMDPLDRRRDIMKRV